MRALLLPLLLCPILIAADEAPKGAASAAAAQKRILTMDELKKFYADEKGRIYTDWTDRDTDTAHFRSFTSVGYSSVLSEGKVLDGQPVYRRAFKHLEDVYPDANRPRWYTNSGMSQEFFDNMHKERLKDNYTLIQMQRFEDDRGTLRYCATWVKIVPAAPK